MTPKKSWHRTWTKEAWPCYKTWAAWVTRFLLEHGNTHIGEYQDRTDRED